MSKEPLGSIVLVHGTGVRLKSYQAIYQSAKNLAASCGLPQQFVPCAWGDPLGVDFEGKSLPDPLSNRASEQKKKTLVGAGCSAIPFSNLCYSRFRTGRWLTPNCRPRCRPGRNYGKRSRVTRPH